MQTTTDWRRETGARCHRKDPERKRVEEGEWSEEEGAGREEEEEEEGGREEDTG